jgi:transcriptional regulator with XRE-family HTH domain
MIGTRIALLRKKRGMTQAVLAAHLHVSPSAIGMYEQGRRTPNGSILIALTEEFHVTADYLLTGRCWTQNDTFSQMSCQIEQLINCAEGNNAPTLSRDALVALIAASLNGN